MRMVELRWINAERPKLLTESMEWPAAFYVGPGMRLAAYIICEDPFTEGVAAMGAHRPLQVVVMKYNHPGQDPMVPRRMRYNDTKFQRIEHLMQWTALYLSQNTSWQPMLI
jgi:hypothetical protein